MYLKVVLSISFTKEERNSDSSSAAELYKYNGEMNITWLLLAVKIVNVALEVMKMFQG